MHRTTVRLFLSAALVVLIFAVSQASAQAPTLGTAASFAVLGDQTVTNTGPSVIVGELGVSPGTAVTGFPPGLVIGAIHSADAVALQAQVDATTAYNILADPIGTPCGTNLTGIDLGLASPLFAGVYCFDTTAGLTGDLVLDAQGDPDAVFIFQIGSTLTTASNSTVTVINGGQNCNVFWQVGSSAILGSGTELVGNILALASITLVTGSNVDGRLLALTGSVTLDSNNVTRCTLSAVIPPDPTLGPPTLAGYSSCDVTTSPAATLLLPYFEVDPSGLGENTLVTITNVSDTSIVVHATVWSNWSFPVLDFNLFLTGYDVVSLSLRDLLVSGNIPNTARVTAISPRGVRSTSGGTWIEAPYNTATQAATCATAQGGIGAIPGFLQAQIESGLTGGPYSAGGVGCGQVGDVSDNMVGYMTFDTSAVCSQSLPTDATYFTTEIRWENQLTGDYIRLNDTAGVAGGNPLVHIAALPGGDSTPITTLPWTFYNRYQSGLGVRDRRQPLPFLFAGRYIEAGTAFDTDFVIWREGVTDEVDTMDCNGTLALNASFPYVEFVRFDERENPTTRTAGCQVSPCPPNQGLSETQLINVNNTSYIPSDPSADTGGWVYFNLTIPEGDPFSWGRPSQNWVQVRMTGANLYGVDFDAAYLANGCQYHVGVTILDGGNGSSSSGEKIGPKYIGGSLIGWVGN